MISQSLLLANRLQEVLLHGHWIANTNYKTQLLQTNWQQATHKIEHLNTIVALTFHINYYLSGLIDAFEKGELHISDRYSFDHTPISSSTEWNNLVSSFLNNANAFVALVKTIDDAALSQPFVQEKYGTIQRNIEGIIEHCYYHLGQLTLLRKMINAANDER